MLDPGATYPFPHGAPLRQTLPPQRIDPPQPPLVASPLASLLRHTWSPPPSLSSNTDLKIQTQQPRIARQPMPWIFLTISSPTSTSRQGLVLTESPSIFNIQSFLEDLYRFWWWQCSMYILILFFIHLFSNCNTRIYLAYNKLPTNFIVLFLRRW